MLLENKYQSKIPLYIGSAVGILGTILTAWTAFKSDKEKYFPSQGNTNGNAQNADVFEAENAEDSIESKTWVLQPTEQLTGGLLHFYSPNPPTDDLPSPWDISQSA